ncbi:UDP-N-acetylglucosamine transporter TMEM241 isoform X6 [Vulpes vulpes]|uniref:UDP-N-acetylglucosamine transporter TMEM241 isoform X6 n=1 Tax=Vulpes vulpes TaxID=9627 RepID=A0ABM4YLN0_VULVU
MCVRRCLVGLTFCTCYLASYLTNKYVLSVLKFTYPTLFQGWQTLIGGLLLHVSWKLGWAEINSTSRSDVSMWLPASVLFVGIIYAGSRALSKLAIPVFLTLHNVAEVIICGHQKCFRKEKTSPEKICSTLFLLAAAGCLPFNDPQRGAPGSRVSSHSGLLGFFLMLSTVKLKNLVAPGQYAAWIFFAKPPARWTWRGLAGFLGAEELLKAGRVDSQAASWSEQPLSLGTPCRMCQEEESRDTEAPTSQGIKESPLRGSPGCCRECTGLCLPASRGSLEPC